MQGLYVTRNERNSKKHPDRPGSRKLIEDILNGKVDGLTIDDINVEATSMFGNEYGGPLRGAPAGEIHFVGPNPHKLRNFYGTLVCDGQGGATIKKVR